MHKNVALSGLSPLGGGKAYTAALAPDPAMQARRRAAVWSMSSPSTPAAPLLARTRFQVR
jgi:hypothetical protein